MEKTATASTATTHSLTPIIATKYSLAAKSSAKTPSRCRKAAHAANQAALKSTANAINLVSGAENTANVWTGKVISDSVKTTNP